MLPSKHGRSEDRRVRYPQAVVELSQWTRGVGMDDGFGPEPERVYEANREWFREIFDGARIGMAIVGLDDRYLEVNHRLCDMVGYSREELLASSHQDVILECGLAE